MRKSWIVFVVLLLCAANELRAQRSELGTSYVTAQFGLTYSELLGGKNFGWRYTSTFGGDHIGMINFDDPGSGTAMCGGVRLIAPISQRFGLIFSVQDVRLMTTATDARTLNSSPEIAGSSPASIQSAYRNVWQYTSGELMLRYTLFPWLYTFGGGEVGVIAGDDFDGAEKILSDGSFYSFKTNAPTGERTMNLSSYWSVHYYNPLRVAAKFGIGTMLALPLVHSWVVTPELAFSIPITPLFNQTARKLYASEGIGIPNLFYTSFTISVGLPLSEPYEPPPLAAANFAPNITKPAPVAENKATLQLRQIRGMIREEVTSAPLAASITATDLTTGKTVGSARADATGHYAVPLAAPGKYSITAEAPGHLFHSVAVTLRADDDDEGVLSPIELTNTTPNTESKVTLLVFFGFNNAMLSAESYPELDRVAKLLKEQPAVQIELAGHTDGDGTDEYNQLLSAKRALAVKNYLVLQGISGSRLTPAGYGKTKPIASNDEEEGRAQNRRVEMVIKASGDLGKK